MRSALHRTGVKQKFLRRRDEQLGRSAVDSAITTHTKGQRSSHVSVSALEGSRAALVSDLRSFGQAVGEKGFGFACLHYRDKGVWVLGILLAWDSEFWVKKLGGLATQSLPSRLLSQIHGDTAHLSNC